MLGFCCAPSGLTTPLCLAGLWASQERAGKPVAGANPHRVGLSYWVQGHAEVCKYVVTSFVPSLLLFLFPWPGGWEEWVALCSRLGCGASAHLVDSGSPGRVSRASWSSSCCVLHLLQAAGRAQVLNSLPREEDAWPGSQNLPEHPHSQLWLVLGVPLAASSPLIFRALVNVFCVWNMKGEPQPLELETQGF